MSGVWERIKQHKVVQWTVAYVAVGFALLQGLDIAANSYGWPRAVVGGFMLALALGTPIVATLAWYHGHKDAQRFTKAELSVLSVLLVLAAGALWLFARSNPSEPTPGAFAPPPRSVAVLSFVNLSGDAKDEYFSDGLSEELLNTLVKITELQVAARTSSFSFKGAATDIPTVGRKLNVGAVLAGSVRKAGDRIRITAQLINAVSGYNLWSESFDRDLKDIFAVQTEIAGAVANAMKVTLLGAKREQLGAGGTSNPQAFDAYLRARKFTSSEESELRAVIAALDEAIRLDPGYAIAHSWRAEKVGQLANDWYKPGPDRERLVADSKAGIDKAIALAPESGQVYRSLAMVLTLTTLDYVAIDAAYRHGLSLEPGNAELLSDYARFAGALGAPDAFAAAERGLALNPLDPGAYVSRGIVRMYQRRYDEARADFAEVARMKDTRLARFWIAWNELAAAHYALAVPLCERDRDSWYSQECLAIGYFQLGRRKEAEAQLARMQSEQGDVSAFQYAEVYAQWGRPDESLRWLETAVRARDSGLYEIKVTPFLDPIRNIPRFGAILAQLKFPE